MEWTGSRLFVDVIGAVVSSEGDPDAVLTGHTPTSKALRKAIGEFLAEVRADRLLSRYLTTAQRVEVDIRPA